MRTLRQASESNAVVICGGIALFIMLAAAIMPEEFRTIAHAQSSPTSLTASTNPATPNIIDLQWSAPIDGIDVAGYHIYRNGQLIFITNATSFTDVGRSAGYYTYSVRAYDASGKITAMSSPASVTVIQDKTAPTAPSDLTATLTSYSPLQIKLSWTASNDDAGVTGYTIYRNGVPLRTDDPVTGTTHVDSNISVGSSYTYRVAAFDSSGNASYQSPPAPITVLIDAAPPSAPAGLTATAGSSATADLTWRSSTDNVEVIGYRIFRNGIQIADISTPTHTYADFGIEDGTYTYTVSAYDLAGNVSPRSNPATVNVVVDIAPPSIPQNVTAKTRSSAQIDLAWSASSDNFGVAGYYIYRDNALISGASSPTYSDTGLASSTQYSYMVTAYDAVGNESSPSYTSRATTLAADPPQSSEPVPPVIAPPPPTAVVPPSAPNVLLTRTLRRGTRSGEVSLLQNLLYQWGYIAADSRTGYFGSLTEQGVKKFQCDHGIVCNGTAATTGWGTVGARTRKAMNELAAIGSRTEPTPPIQSLHERSLPWQANVQLLERALWYFLR